MLEATRRAARKSLAFLACAALSLSVLVGSPSVQASTTAEKIESLLNKKQAMARQDQSGPRLADYLSAAPVQELVPGANRLGVPGGDPTVAPAFTGDKQVGYVYLTSDVVNTRGYSSLPIDILVGLSMDGEIVGAKLVDHHEPIVLIGVPDSAVVNFINGYVGKNYYKAPPRPGDAPPVDIVSGATVTLMVVGDSITRSSMLVARAHIGGEQSTAGAAAAAAAAAPTEKRSIVMDEGSVQSWDELLASGAISHLHVSVDDVNQAFIKSGRQGAIDRPEPGDPEDSFIDLYAALVSVPSIGRSVLGQADWDWLKERLKPGQQAIVVAGEGRYSFKGSGYVRGGVFDRIEVIQGDNGIQFSDSDHERLGDIMAAGAPSFREIALFTIPADATFDPTEPWRLQLMVQRVMNVQQKAFTTFNLNYELPASLVKVEPIAAAPAAQGAAPAGATDWEQGPQLWKQIWIAKTGQIIVISFALVTLIGLFFFQDQLTKHEKFYKRFRIAFLLFSLFWIGWYAKAQPSVVNVLTFTHALMNGFHWDYFLMDPIVFLLWVATAVSMIFWNRGAFCGWLCPFGALQELTNKLARALHVPQIKVRHGVHTRLAGLKYVIFIGLFGVSLYQMALAEMLAEIEPFKTAIILKFIRDWPFVIFAVLLVGAGLFIERFYCRYLCPMGAALAIPAKLRIFDWLRRYKMCGNPCQLCAVECPVQAIKPEGDIDPNECIQCLNCQQLYHNDNRCPHLIQKNAKLRKKPAPASATPAAPVTVVTRRKSIGKGDGDVQPQAH